MSNGDRERLRVSSISREGVIEFEPGETGRDM